MSSSLLPASQPSGSQGSLEKGEGTRHARASVSGESQAWKIPNLQRSPAPCHCAVRPAEGAMRTAQSCACRRGWWPEARGQSQEKCDLALKGPCIQPALQKPGINAPGSPVPSSLLSPLPPSYLRRSLAVLICLLSLTFSGRHPPTFSLKSR